MSFVLLTLNAVDLMYAYSFQECKLSHQSFLATTIVLFRQAREVYRPVAAEASLMYFMLLKLSSVDFMYQYSLDSFTR